jgi:hypothetical protein
MSGLCSNGLTPCCDSQYIDSINFLHLIVTFFQSTKKIIGETFDSVIYELHFPFYGLFSTAE